MSQKQKAYEALTSLGITFGRVEHPAVFTVEEMRSLAFPQDSRVAKNLFLRDAKGKRHFLIVADCDQTVDLKRLEQELESTKLSSTSEERLHKYLVLTKGSVSPLGLLNDTESAVEVFVDKSLQDAGSIGVHPNDNTATVFISYDDLCKFITAMKHTVNVIDFHPAAN